MATTVTVTSEFIGVGAKDIFVQMFKKADTISKGLITILPNVIGSVFLPKLSYSDTLHAATCGWNATGTIALVDKEMTTKQFEIANELCKKDFAQTFQAQNAGLFSAHSEVPSDIKEAILLAIVNNTAAVIDTAIWQETSAFSGLLAQFVADSSVVKVSGATAITTANVMAQMSNFDDAVPAILDGETDLVYIVSRNVGKAYKKALNSLGINTPVGEKELDYMGTKLEIVNGLPNNTMAAYKVSNLFLGTGLESDLQNINVYDTDAIVGDGMVRTKLQLVLGVGYSDSASIVLYKA